MSRGEQVNRYLPADIGVNPLINHFQESVFNGQQTDNESMCHDGRFSMLQDKA